MRFNIVSVSILRNSVLLKNIYIKADSITDDIRAVWVKVWKSIHIGKRKHYYHCIEKSMREMI